MNNVCLSYELLVELFQSGNYNDIIVLAEANNLNPSVDARLSNVVAASLFKLDRFDECLQWCNELEPALRDTPDFSSLYGAVLRRSRQLEKAAEVFRNALTCNPGHTTLLNNFANTLIDLEQYNEAEAILTQLVKDNPDYRDAEENLNRLRFQQVLKDTTSNEVAKVDGSERALHLLRDPLIAAFAEEEVNVPSTSQAPRSDQLLQSLPPRSGSKEADELLKVARKLVASDPKQTLEDCRTYHKCYGVSPEVYEVASQAYIRLKLFGDAESCLLNAIALGGSKIENLLNLANLVAMRGDQKLALIYLEKVALTAPSDQRLAAVQKALFPHGVPEFSTTPFQINLEQQGTGNFQ